MSSLTAAPHRVTRAVVAAAALVAASVALLAAGAAPASAARHIQQAPNFVCDGARIGVAPPRVWSDPGRPETVAWAIQLDRWDGSRWYRYSVTTTYSTFNYYGQSLTSWSGGRFVNSRYWVPVYHRGHYRVGSVVATGGGQRAVGYLSGGAYCTVR
jgi:hypothetical protein